MKKTLRKVVGFLSGYISILFAAHGFLIIMSNKGAKISPDGLPLDPVWTIWVSFAIAVILAVAAIAIYPDKIRKNRYKIARNH